MNKILAFVAMLLLTGLSGLSGLKAQETDVAFNVINSTATGKADGKIEVMINEGSPSFTVFLFDKAPWKGGAEIRRHEDVTSGTVIFDGLLPGNYYIVVEDSEKNPFAGNAVVGIISNN